jgi:hypothetical protein
MYAARSQRIEVLEGPMIASVDPVRIATRRWAMGLAIGASIGLGASAVLLIAESERNDDRGHDTRMVAFGASTIGHGVLTLIAWPVALLTRTSIEVHRSFPAVAVTPRSASLTWSF